MRRNKGRFPDVLYVTRDANCFYAAGVLDVEHGETVARYRLDGIGTAERSINIGFGPDEPKAPANGSE